MKKYKKVLVGLDIGTNSVGWCVTDENSKIIKKNGKSLWGYRGFEEGESAEERRLYRTSRRRLNRRKERIDLLREIFKDEINKIDNSFFFRLDNAFYKHEDRDSDFNYTIFNDKNYTDKDFYKQYPTIYHLRYQLINSNKKEDIRLIYLALHHIIKYRGNFLYGSDEFKPLNEEQCDKLFEFINEELKEYNKELNYNKEVFYELKEVNGSFLKLSELKDKYNDILNTNKDKYLKNCIIPLMVGAEVALAKTGLKNIENNAKLCVKNEEFDSQLEALINDNPTQDKLINIFSICKQIFEFFLIGKLLGDNVYISKAMIDKYNNHKEQLSKLKKYVKEKHPEKYNLIFRTIDEKNNNYAHYVGSTIYNNKTSKRCSHITQDDFYNFLKKELNISDKSEDEYLLEVFDLINKGEFLNRQNSTNNAVFPYQLNKMEMKIILEKQSKYYPFLLDVTDNLSNRDRILSILEYHIPFYVGPLITPKSNNERSKFSWIARTEEKIYPWNFKKVVDLDSTAEKFIEKMLTKCTYLPKYYCLPKNSILFSYYNVLSFLNKTNINGRAFTPEEKQDIIANVFMKRRKVTKKILIDYLIVKFGNKDVSLATSNQKELQEINCDMSSYYDFSSIFDEIFVKNNLEFIENIIRDICIFTDKSILEERLKNTYKLDSAKIKLVKGLNYSKYANISKELLTDIMWIEKDDKSGEVFRQETILSVMEKTNQNLQEVIYDKKYNFSTLIEKYNKENLDVCKDESIESYIDLLGTISPIMKRSIIQAYKICDEIEKILGQRIDEYYIECNRTNKSDKKRTDSRRKKLLNIYDEAIKLTENKEKEELKELRKTLEELPENRFQSDKYYLYFTQMGRCLYSGDKIEIEELFDTNKYDIDHIYPQSLIKDDSLDNRVLVKQEFNKEKSDQYPIPTRILFKGNYNEALSFYKVLIKNKFISEEKFKRLTAKELTETELESFINRQLVSTNQAVKGFISAIKALKTTDKFEPKIIYSKSENISDFRNKYGLLKSREINNFHHGHDAYLNIIVGRTIDTYFNSFKFKYHNMDYLKMMQHQGFTTNFLKIFDQNDHRIKEDIYENGNLVWSYSKSLKEIKYNIYERFDLLTTERAYVANKIFKKVSILPASKGNIPVKENCPLSNVNKYGGFKEYSYGFYCLIKTNDGHILEAIPTRFKNDIDSYLRLQCNYSNYKIIIKCLKINTVFVVGKKKFVITGKSGNSYVLKNKIERIFNESQIKIIKKIEKLHAKLNTNLEDKIIDDTIIISPARNENVKEIRLNKSELLEVYEYIIALYSREVFGYSNVINVVEKLKNSKSMFIGLTIQDQATVVMNLLNLLKCNERNDIDLSLLNQDHSKEKHVGVIKMNKLLHNCKIVYESITGYYQKVIYEIK